MFDVGGLKLRKSKRLSQKVKKTEHNGHKENTKNTTHSDLISALCVLREKRRVLCAPN
jgi:hypothetical protein